MPPIGAISPQFFLCGAQMGMGELVQRHFPGLDEPTVLPFFETLTTRVAEAQRGEELVSILVHSAVPGVWRWSNEIIAHLSSGGQTPVERIPLEFGVRAKVVEIAQRARPQIPIVTLEQLTEIRMADFLPGPAQTREEGRHIREKLSRWIETGRLKDHVQGLHGWDNRMLENVRQGRLLLPTHSTSLDATVAILNSGVIDPQFSRRNRSDFRYGLGHSYGEVVLVFGPEYEELGRLHDIWDVLPRGRHPRQALADLVGRVRYNRDIRAKDPQALAPFGWEPPVEGRSCVLGETDRTSLMEHYPQFESTTKVGLGRLLCILAPEHLYDELLRRISGPHRDLVIRMPGTGSNQAEFAKGRDQVIRRSRYRGGDFQPLIGSEALLHYEMTYFKCIEVLLRYRHQRLRHFLDDLATSAARSNLTHTEIEKRVKRLLSYSPETFHLLQHQTQFPSHDGRSPLVHTLNALIEAATLAPSLAREFPGLHIAEAFTALYFHDIGKLDGGQEEGHGKRSMELGRYHVKMMNEKYGAKDEAPERRDRILRLIENSGLISEASLALERGESLSSVRARLLPKAEQLLPEMLLVNYSDTASIPGRSGRDMKVNKDYQSQVIDVRPRLIEVFRKLNT